MKTKRALNNQPVQLMAELLVVTDLSVYIKQQKFIGTTDMNTTFEIMRVFYAHLINGVYILSVYFFLK